MAAQERGGRGVRASRGHEPSATLASLIDDPDHVVVAGLIDDVIVGYAAATIEALRDAQHAAASSTDLYVEPRRVASAWGRR